MDQLTQHLQTMLGPGASFRDGQREAICRQPRGPLDLSASG